MQDAWVWQCTRSSRLIAKTAVGVSTVACMLLSADREKNVCGSIHCIHERWRFSASTYTLF